MRLDGSRAIAWKSATEDRRTSRGRVEGSRERSDAGREDVVGEALSVLPHIILSDTVFSLFCIIRSPVDFSLRVSLTLSATLAPTLVPPPVLCVPTASGLARLSRAHIRLNRSGQLTTPLRVAGSCSASLRPLSCARLTRSYKYGYRTPYHSALLTHYALPRRLPPRFSPFT